MSDDMIGVREILPASTTQVKVSPRDRLRKHGKISKILVSGAGVPYIAEPVVVKRSDHGDVLGWFEPNGPSVKYVKANNLEVKVLATFSN